MSLLSLFKQLKVEIDETKSEIVIHWDNSNDVFSDRELEIILSDDRLKTAFEQNPKKADLEKVFIQLYESEIAKELLTYLDPDFISKLQSGEYVLEDDDEEDD